MLLNSLGTYLAVDAPPGVWVCSTDMLLCIPVPLSADSFKGGQFCIIATPASHRYARHNGALKIGDNAIAIAQDIIYKGKLDVLAEFFGNADIPIMTRVVYISTTMAEKLLSLTIAPPLDACTYIGLDNGAQPIELSIFFDIALAMCGAIDYDAYVTGERSGVFGTSEKLTGRKGSVMKHARALLWRELHESYQVTVIVAEQGQYSYMDQVASTLHGNLLAGTILKAAFQKVSRLVRTPASQDSVQKICWLAPSYPS